MQTSRRADSPTVQLFRRSSRALTRSVDSRTYFRAVEPIEQLTDDLWMRWRREMERPTIDDVASRTASGRVLYARQPLFDLKTYAPRRFKAGGRHAAVPFAGQDNWVYHLDEAGRPVRMETRQSFNGVDWLGTYRYAVDEAEYIEWCVQTGVCSEYARVVTREEHAVTFQRLLVNGRGSFAVWRGMSRSAQMDRIASDPNHFRIRIERHNVSNGHVESGDAYSEGLGAPPVHSALLYTYEGGTLTRIVERSAWGEQTVFAARRQTSLRQLSAALSRRIADRALDLLRERPDRRPLIALELSYRLADTYVPLLVPCTEHDSISDLRLCLAIEPGRWLELAEESFAPDITDFTERLRRTGQYSAGTRMLRDAARELTTRVPRELGADRFFVAYAVDWEAEGDQLEDLLRDCGATPESLRALKSRGWL